MKSNHWITQTWDTGVLLFIFFVTIAAIFALFASLASGEDLPNLKSKIENPKFKCPSPQSRVSNPESGCPICCCGVEHPKGATEEQTLGYCLRSNESDCKLMCERSLAAQFAQMDAREVAKTLERRVPGIKFSKDRVEITETALRAITVMILERDLVMGTR